MELIMVSFAVVHMQKIKSPALKGMQFHHQRERESKTNPDIDDERTDENYDLANDENIDFNVRVKEIIESQKTGTRKTRKEDRKSTRLNSSHVAISYAVFCLKKKKKKKKR